jgi:hypothetical protein
VKDEVSVLLEDKKQASRALQTTLPDIAIWKEEDDPSGI